jgi:hypothetical protein
MNWYPILSRASGLVTCGLFSAALGLSPVAASDRSTLTVNGGQINAERILWKGGNPTGTGSLDFAGGLIQVQSSSENVNAGPAANPLSGSTKLLNVGSELLLAGISVLQSQRLGLTQGGTIILDGHAVLDITGSAIESAEGSGLTSDFHPTFDFIQSFLNGTWSQVQGRILFRSSGSGQIGQGALVRVLGRSENLSNGVDSVTVEYRSLFLAAIENGKIVTDVPGGSFRVEWDGTHTNMWLVVPRATVSNAWVAHASWSGSIEESIDLSKSLAKEGTGPRILNYQNLINSSRGIDSVVFEIDQLGAPNDIGAGDFVFQISPPGAFSETLNPVANWPAAPLPTSVSVLAGSPSRIRIAWPERSIMNRWLRITIKANSNTDLAADEVYYIGHLLGETTGESLGSAFIVQFDDIMAIRNSIGNVVDASGRSDIDKNGIVQFTDITAMRPNIGAALTTITIP